MKLRGLKTHGLEPHTLAGAYAMDAISAPDRARFERHLAGCEECAQEIAGLREATARLATATAVPPPSALKERVMAAAALTRQQPPPVTEVGTETPARIPAILPWFRALALPRRMAVAAAALAVVAVLAVAVVFGVSDGSMRDQLKAVQASSQQIAAVLTARDATMMTGTVTGGGTVTIVMSHSRHALVFTAADLRALPASRGYELWLIGPAGDRPVTMLPPGPHDMTGPVIASGLQAGDHLALTAEPAGGTARPTAPMMLDVLL
jgi:anti-sigma-K factor RskA